MLTAFFLKFNRSPSTPTRENDHFDFPAPVTPEQNRHAEREQNRLQRLQMTSPSNHHGRSPHPGPDPDIELPHFNIPPETCISSQLDRPREHPMPVVPTLPVFPTRGRCHRQLHGGAPEGQSSVFDSTSVLQLPVGPQGQGRGGGRGHGRGRAIEIHPPCTEPQQNIDRITSTEHSQQSPSPTRESPPLQPPLPLPHQHQPPHAIPVQLPLARRPYAEVHSQHNIGSRKYVCEHCKALHWHEERLKNKSKSTPHFGMCCLQGQVKLPPLLPAPAILQNLLCGNNPLSKAFLQDIRQYNAALAFTSLAVKVDEAITNSSGPYCFRVSGELHHWMGSLLPQEEGKLSYAQLYIHDPAEALSMRNRCNPNLNPEIMSQLQDLMQDINPYVALY